MLKKKIISFFLTAILSIGISLFVSHYVFGQGVTITNVWGWMWAGTTDDSLTGSAIDRGTGIGWISGSHLDPQACFGCGAEYGLIVKPYDPLGNNDVTGHAWSGNIGWINFQPSGPYPTCEAGVTCPNHGVRRINETNFLGWARIVSIETAVKSSAPTQAGGLTGWIKVDGPLYQTQLKEKTGTVSGFDYTHRFEQYAWSDEFGWIIFGLGDDDNPPLLVADLDNVPEFDGSCFGNPDPAFLNPNAIVTWNASASGGSGPYTFEWSMNRGNPNMGTGQVVTTEYSPPVAPGWRKARVTITDEGAPPGPNKQIQRECQITVIETPPPMPAVACSGNIAPGPSGTFDVTWTASVSGATSPSYSWIFPNGNPNLKSPPPTDPQEIVEYDAPGLKHAQIFITSPEGNTDNICSVDIGATKKEPLWKEVIPFF